MALLSEESATACTVPVASVATTERASGHDPLRIATRVQADGDGFRLDGEKRVVLHAPIADVLPALVAE